MSGDHFDPTGMVIKAYYVNQADSNEEKEDIVTKYCTLTPSTENVLAGGNDAISISYSEGGITKHTTAPITVTASFTVDFESGLASYTGLTFTNFVSGQSSITAQSGSCHGSVDVSAKAAGQHIDCTIQTVQKLPSPKSVTFYVSRAEENVSDDSTWTIQVSEDGNDWTELTTANSYYNATWLSKGQWVKLSADLSSYHNVYVQIRYSGSNYERCIDSLQIEF